ncbi:MAG: MafI family immunity protein [Pseudomonadota bacterium]
MTCNYQHIEEVSLGLLELLQSVFTSSEKIEVHEFIDAGEYGLALETLVDIVIEEDKQISSEAMKLVYKLAEMMEWDKEAFEEKLHSHVING